MSSPLPSLDALLHQPARTQLVAFLSGRGEATFSELKRVLGITDGNLGAHLNKLIEAGYIASGAAAADSVRSTTGNMTVGGRAQTIYSLTADGRTALSEYVIRLSALLAISSGDDTNTAATDMPLAVKKPV